MNILFFLDLAAGWPRPAFLLVFLQTFVLFFACLLHSGTARCDRRRIDFFPQIHYL
jgi:hypothetical protein